MPDSYALVELDQHANVVIRIGIPDPDNPGKILEIRTSVALMVLTDNFTKSTDDAASLRTLLTAFDMLGAAISRLRARVVEREFEDPENYRSEYTPDGQADEWFEDTGL